MASTVVYKLNLDEDSVASTIESLKSLSAELAEFPVEVRKLALAAFHSGNDILRINNGSALGADCICRLELTPFCLDLFSALRTGELKNFLANHGITPTANS